jgi:AcrR family transcriptional regulator
MAPRRNTGERRTEIADAALAVIAAQGLGRFTAAAVAAEVGVSDAALFRHFDSMDDIVLGAIDRAGSILFEDFPPTAADPIERIGQFFRRRVAVIASHPGVARVVLSDDLAFAAPAVGIARVAEFKRRSVGFVRQCLSEAVAAGLLDPALSHQAAVVVITGSLVALAQAAAASEGNKAARNGLADDVWATIERVLRSS